MMKIVSFFVWGKVAQLINFLYLCAMERKIRLYGDYFKKFKQTLTEKEQDKIDYCLLLLKTQDRVPSKFISYIKEGLYELRVEYNSNIYRVFFIFDDGNIVVLFNGFQKRHKKLRLTK